jgi:hypothetical protein
MNARITNPFNVTKADDFSDSDIAAYYVDMPSGGFLQIANPNSPTSLLIRGGKGSGKTHIMRYWSYAIQRIRAGAAVIPKVREEGYIGIYSRCGGLNASRFSGKGQPAEVWTTLFAYYIELWLSQLVLGIVHEFCGSVEAPAKIESAVDACLALLDEEIPGESSTLLELANRLHQEQRQLDIEINNVAMTRTLHARIAATPGRLVFGIPRVLSTMLPSCEGLMFAYLLDEYENFQEDQQKYFNTLGGHFKTGHVWPLENRPMERSGPEVFIPWLE